jgi:hypothetical protein
MSDAFAFAAEEHMKEAFFYIRNHLFLEKTGLIYDHIVVGQEEDFPTAAEISSGFPNPGGYSTGMEDGMINGDLCHDVLLESTSQRLGYNKNVYFDTWKTEIRENLSN